MDILHFLHSPMNGKAPTANWNNVIGSGEDPDLLSRLYNDLLVALVDPDTPMFHWLTFLGL